MEPAYLVVLIAQLAKTVILNAQVVLLRIQLPIKMENVFVKVNTLALLVFQKEERVKLVVLAVLLAIQPNPVLSVLLKMHIWMRVALVCVAEATLI